MAFASLDDEGDDASLPLVLAVNCLADSAFERNALQGIGRFRSVSLAMGAPSGSFTAEALIEQASVLVLLTLQDLPPALQSRVFMAPFVVLLSTANRELETVAAEQLGVQRLLQVPLETTDEFADTTIALMLDLLRRTHSMADAVHKGVWTPSLSSLAGMRRCRDLQLGLVGLGAVALQVARRAKAFGMRVTAWDPMDGHSDDEEEVEEAKEGSGGRERRQQEWEEAAAASIVRANTLQDLLETSDVVSLHAPMNHVTAGMICEGTLAWFKPGALLVNVTNGALVNPVELKLALISGKVQYCAPLCMHGFSRAPCNKSDHHL